MNALYQQLFTTASTAMQPTPTPAGRHYSKLRVVAFDSNGEVAFDAYYTDFFKAFDCYLSLAKEAQQHCLESPQLKLTRGDFYLDQALYFPTTVSPNSLSQVSLYFEC